MTGEKSKHQDRNLRVLGIETSCDETAASVVEGGRKILSNIVASQASVHAKYGGVFPEVASRRHVEVIDRVILTALEEAHLSFEDLDAVAVTRGPGLAGSLVIGLNLAKGLALATGLPLLGINHLEAHIYSLFLLEETHPVHFPVLCLIVSGGHTELILMKDHGDYHRLGATLDDAAGEAFDKVARLLGLSYPGGPAIEQAARSGRADAYHLPRAMLEGTWDFSFSGLKTAMIRLVQRLQPETRPGMPPATGPLPLPDLAAAFQAAVVEVLVRKASLAARQFQATQLFVAGGVSANQTLRKSLEEAAPCPVRTPPAELCTDNAAMVAAAGCHRALAGEGDPLDIDVLPDWALGITAEGESIGQA
ncbi:MAG: tRNA (adenosine(37)-N6)-threonylcarbamoyltransferase complex transferase subunit TsaD [Anaerolineales bacterium]|jgi:N6-L-threonylcarbamoyladenine synthase